MYAAVSGNESINSSIVSLFFSRDIRYLATRFFNDDFHRGPIPGFVVFINLRDKFATCDERRAVGSRIRGAPRPNRRDAPFLLSGGTLQNFFN